MPQRSYQQYCSLARALDLVGERWTLLILRDLLPGARRYKELLEGLPGIGTNLLADRLKELVRLGLIEQERHEDRRAKSYRLTSAGRELEDALVALARFGTKLLGAKASDELWSARWTPLALKASFKPEAARGVRETYEFHIDDEVFHASVRGSRLETKSGPASKPNLILEATGEEFLALASGALSPRQAMASKTIGVQGDLATLRRCHAIFGLA